MTSSTSSLPTQVERASAVPAVTAIFFVHGLLFASWVAHIPQVKAKLGIGLGMLGIALLGAPIGSILAMSAAGYLVPRLGSRRVARVGMVGYCLAGSLLGVAQSLIAFIIVYGLWGLFQGTLEVAMNTQGVAVEGLERRPVMPMFHGSWSLGALAGAFAGTLAVAMGVPLASQLLVLGAVSLGVLGGMTRRLLPEDHRELPEGPVSTTRATPPRRWWTTSLLILCVVALADMLCEGAAADWSAVYLRSSFHSTGVIAGLAYTLYSLAMVVTRFAGRRLVVRWPKELLIPALTALASLGFAVGLIVHNPTVTLVAFGCLGVGCALVIPTTYSTVGQMASENPGRGVALVSGIGWIGFVAGPAFIGQIAAVTTLRLALITLPVLTALITILLASNSALKTNNPDMPTEASCRSECAQLPVTAAQEREPSGVTQRRNS